MPKKKAITPLKAIHDYCRYNCCNHELDPWKNCPVTECNLHAFRFGTNPFRKGRRKLTTEQKNKAVERMNKAKEAKRKDNDN